MSTPTSSIAPASDELIEQIESRLRLANEEDEFLLTAVRCDHVVALLARITQVEQERDDLKEQRNKWRFRARELDRGMKGFIESIKELKDREQQWAERIAQVRALEGYDINELDGLLGPRPTPDSQWVDRFAVLALLTQEPQP